MPTTSPGRSTLSTSDRSFLPSLVVARLILLSTTSCSSPLFGSATIQNSLDMTAVKQDQGVHPGRTTAAGGFFFNAAGAAVEEAGAAGLSAAAGG